MFRLLAGALILAVSAAATVRAEEPLLQKARKLFKPLPLKAAPVAGAAHPHKLELGKLLFFEPRLSTSGLISCNTCHNLGLGGTDLRETSIGHGWQKGNRNSPSIFNTSFNSGPQGDSQTRELRRERIAAAAAMHSTPDHVMATLRSIPEYVILFHTAFPRDMEPVTLDNLTTAVEEFLYTLTTPASRFDRYLRGKADALDSMEAKGLDIFIRTGCASCHSGINLGGNAFHRFGKKASPPGGILAPDDVGRYALTGDEEDRFVFRTPSLRNVGRTPPYFHSGTVWNLHEAVAVMGTAQLGVTFQPGEAEAVSYFLKTLTGIQPKIEYPLLPASSPSTPRPELP